MSIAAGRFVKFAALHLGNITYYISNNIMSFTKAETYIMNIVRSIFQLFWEAPEALENAPVEAMEGPRAGGASSGSILRRVDHDAAPARPARISSVLGMPRW